MPGLVPGIHVLRRPRVREDGQDVWCEDASRVCPAMTADARRLGPQFARAIKILFIIFVDAIFTTLFEWLFTNVFDVIGAKSANDCVCRARHAG